MAVFYVSPSGNNSDAGTSEAPLKTFSKANEKAVDGDTIIGKTGVFQENVKVNSGITYRGLPGCIIDAENTRSNCFNAYGVHHFVIEGFECRNSNGGLITMNSGCYNAVVRENVCHGCNGNGIFWGNSDTLLLEDNEVYDCAVDGGSYGVQGISILYASNVAGATVPVSWNAGTNHNGAVNRIVIRGNITRDNVTMFGPKSDSCGIIIDRAHTPPRNFQGGILIESHLAYGNGGPGIRLMYSKGCLVRYCTSYGNMQDTRKTDTWGCDMHETQSEGNRWEYNISLSTNTRADCHAFMNTNSRDIGASDTTYFHNVFKGIGGRDAKSSNNGQAVNGFYKGPVPGTSDNKIGVDPEFTAVGISGKTFELKSTSPAKSYGASGRNAGYWQGAVTPTPNIEIDAAPVLTISGDKVSGKAATFTAGTYTLTPSSVTRTVQWYNGVTYETKAAPITGPVSGVYSFTIPEVPKIGGLRIMETFSGTGVTDGKNPSNRINVGPAPVSTDKPPVNTALPVISPSTPVVGSACVVSDGSWDGDPAPTFARQWKVNGVNIPGATGSSYVPTSSDFGKALTAAVTGTNSVGSATAVSAATYNVVNPTDVTLAEAVARLVTAEAEIAALRAADVAQAGRDDNQDTALRGVETGLIARIDAVGLNTDSVRNRVEALEDAVATNAALIDPLAEATANLAAYVDELEAIGRVRVSRRRTVVVLPVGTVDFGAVEVQLTSAGPGDPGTIKVKVAQVPDGIALGKLVIAGDAAPNAYTFTPAAGGWCAPFTNLDASLTDPAKAWVEAINDDGAALAAAKLVDIQFVTI